MDNTVSTTKDALDRIEETLIKSIRHMVPNIGQVVEITMLAEIDLQNSQMDKTA
jgi:hypothetical protein